MDVLLENQEILVDIFKVVAFIFCFFLVVIFVFYNWLYLSRLLKSNDQIGLRPPQHIAQVVKTCIYIPVFTAVFIVFFMILDLY